MPRKYIDCREYPSEKNCTVAISADSDDELLEVTPTSFRIRNRSLAYNDRIKKKA